MTVARSSRFFLAKVGVADCKCLLVKDDGM